MSRAVAVSLVHILAARVRVGAALGLVAVAQPAHAQASAVQPPEPTSGWGFHVSEGTLIPTGEQRGLFRQAHVTAVEVSYLVRPEFSIHTMTGWARGRDVAAGKEAKLDVFLYDLGVEWRGRRWGSSLRRSLTPFIGVGGGGRTYDHRGVEIVSAHDGTAYVGAGGAVGLGRIRLRVDVRNYFTGFRSLVRAAGTKMHHDVVVMTSLRLAGR